LYLTQRRRGNKAKGRGERSEVSGNTGINSGQRNFYPDEDMVKQTLNVSRKGAKVKK